MKWKTRYITCGLLAGLTALMLSGCNRAPSVQLLATKVLDFPSASGVEFYKDTLFVFGDNATRLLLLSPAYRQIGSYTYWHDNNDSIIDKASKPDIESAMLVHGSSGPTLYGVGSMSAKNRWRVYESRRGNNQWNQTQFFDSNTTFEGISEINIEGSTAVKDYFLFCNRANLTTRKNHLLLWNKKDSIAVKEVQLPQTGGVAGMSGLYYAEDKDVLLFTASEEATTNAYEDGAIGESYVGWINRFSVQLGKGAIRASGLLKLTSFDSAFRQQKIEGICVEEISGDGYTLHLVADNDNGKSVLFKILAKLPADNN
jgi:hypothetical protein